MNSEINARAEVLKPADKTPPSSPVRPPPQKAHPSDKIEHAPAIQSRTGHVTHEQHDGAATGYSDRYLVRADTEQSVGVVEQLNPGILLLQMSQLPTTGPPDDSLASEELLKWRAHHQDFYASKWFRSIQIWIIFSIIVVALVLYIIVSPVESFDLFASPPSFGTILISTFLFLGPVVGLCFY